jgi:hypothetical protein
MATMTPVLKRSHQFHAEAHVLSGELNRPVQQKIEPHLPVALKDERGGHLTRFTEDVSIEGLISFKTGHTRVSGSKSLKHQGWVTLTTSIIEGYNVLEVVTADRVVSQVSTDHPYPELPQNNDAPNPEPPYENGHVPHVTFLGSKFENLQVGGFPLKLTLNLDICGKKPKDNKSYLEDADFLSRVQKQVKAIVGASFLPASIKKLYNDRLTEIENVASHKGGWTVDDDPVKVTCSIVESIDIKGIPIPGLETIGNVLVIPHFGAVLLGDLEVGLEKSDPSNGFTRHDPGSSSYAKGGGAELSNYFELTMLEMELGCIAHGNVIAAKSKTNGQTSP